MGEVGRTFWMVFLLSLLIVTALYIGKNYGPMEVIIAEEIRRPR